MVCLYDIQYVIWYVCEGVSRDRNVGEQTEGKPALNVCNTGQ
jgi:hypothetical protein